MAAVSNTCVRMFVFTLSLPLVTCTFHTDVILTATSRGSKSRGDEDAASLHLSQTLADHARDKDSQRHPAVDAAVADDSLKPKGRPGSEGYYCFRQNCWCEGDKADCSMNYGDLTFIPALPHHTRFLNFSYNNLTAIEGDDFFLNVTFINSLDLSGNGLEFISPGAFQTLPKLIFLFLNYNHNLTYDILRPVFSVSTLQRLDVRHGTLGPVPDDLFYRYPLPRLNTLYLHENHLHRVNMSAFRPLKGLKKLGLGGNLISDIHPDRVPGLERLTLDGNALTSFPETCHQGNSMFPRLGLLSMSYNHLSSLPHEVCLPKLHVLAISGNKFSSLVTDMFHQDKFPALLELHMQSNGKRIQSIERYAFRNNVLNKISLMYNNLQFQDEAIHTQAFGGCPKLINLQLSHNYMDELTDRKFQQLFGNLTALQTLYLTDNRLRHIPVETVGKLRSLRKLSLAENDLTSIPDGVFDTLPELQELDLGRNQISVVRETTFSEACRRRLRRLDLSGNPFSCSCSIIWFRDWLRSNASLFHDPWTHYSCGDVPHTPLVEFNMNLQACLLSDQTSMLIVVCASLVILIFTSSSLLYRYRWHIRLVLYEACRGRGDRADRWRRLQERDFQFDVFVCYAGEDTDWVRQHLMPELEDRRGLRLCIHQRDFIPGKHIVDNIVHCVEGSKKVMMLFSPDFALSPWCQFELTLCLSHVMDNDDALVVVRLKDMPSRDLTPAMMAVMKTTTYIEWGDGRDATASFWGRLQVALQEVIPAPEP